MLKTRLAECKLLDTRKKRIIALVLSVVLLLLAVYGLLRFGFGLDIVNRSGFYTHSGITQYLNYFGIPKTGWQYVDDQLYYFTPGKGAMATGWQEINGYRYYFGADGVRMTGWQTVDGKTYYLGVAGKMVTGWQQINDQSYYFADDGAMATGWQTVEGKRSYFSDAGMALTGWQQVDGKLYYFTADGYTVSGWVELDNVRFRFADDGAAVTGWYEDETGRYFFDEDGRPHSGWLDWEEKRYYCNPDGTMATGWLELEKDRYYLHPDGTMAVGEVKIEEVSHFFTSTGKSVLLCNPWHPVPEDYVLTLSSIEGFQFDSTGRDALQKMMEDCRAEDLSCVINNTYRSKTTQQRMWDQSVQKYMATGMTKEEAEKKTGRDTAIPGHSEHQTGLAVDLNGSQATYDWLGEHCWEYGFILRYPDNKIDITGIIYEPWHFRYVGTELSMELKELNLCMEEYMTMLTEKQTQPAQ